LSFGFLPGERTAIFVCCVLLFFLSFPIGPMIYAALLSLIVRRIVSSSNMRFLPVKAVPIVSTV
jgi:hypothetical protein